MLSICSGVVNRVYAFGLDDDLTNHYFCQVAQTAMPLRYVKALTVVSTAMPIRYVKARSTLVYCEGPSYVM